MSFASDPATHLALLAMDLADETSPSPPARAQAGLILKNHLTSKDHAQAEKLANDWMALNAEVRQRVKESSITALGSQHNPVRLASAQVIAKIATIELPKPGQWEDLMQRLLDYVVKPEASTAGVHKKEAALNTIGYICEEIAQLETTCLEARSNEILTAVVAGMRADEPEPKIKVAATKALSNALEFAKRNFDVDNERDYLMTVICEACTQGITDEVKENAFECLGRIAELYYDKLPTYMQTILELSLTAINTQEDSVARQAINVWVQVCDAEYDADEGQNQKFIKGASRYLIPVLLQTMAKQEDDQDPDSFNKSTEAAWCLAAVATVIENDIIEHVVPWVTQNIQHGDWHLKEAAVMAYGCILDGMNEQANMPSHAPPVLDFCLGYIKDDPNDLVKNSSAWTITKICESEHAFETIADARFPERVQRILEVMHTAEPATSAHLAISVRHIADNVLRMVEDGQSAGTYPLAPMFSGIVECLYATADRPDATESNLRHECYEAMAKVLESANPEKAPDAAQPAVAQVVTQYIIPVLLPRFGERLNAELGKPVVNADDNNARTEWVGYFCGAIQMCISALQDKAMLTTPDANQQTVADKFMILFLQVFQFQNTTVAAEALLAVNQIVNKLDKDFERYLAAFVPVLVGCLGAVQDVPLCRCAIATVSDMALKLQDKVLPHSDAIVQALLAVWANPAVDADINQVHDYIKPEVCSAIGDLAREIGKGMEKYLAIFLQALQQAGMLSAKMRQEFAGQDPDEDRVEYLNALIAGALEGYTGILYGLKDAEENGAVGAIDAFAQPDALQNGCLVMLNEVADCNRTEPPLLLPDDNALSKAVGIVGDIAQNFKGRQSASMIKQLLATERIGYLADTAKSSKDDDGQASDLAQTAVWAEQHVRNLA